MKGERAELAVPPDDLPVHWPFQIVSAVRSSGQEAGTTNQSGVIRDPSADVPLSEKVVR